MQLAPMDKRFKGSRALMMHGGGMRRTLAVAFERSFLFHCKPRGIAPFHTVAD